LRQNKEELKKTTEKRIADKTRMISYIGACNNTMIQADF
jgi:hypothetical protein